MQAFTIYKCIFGTLLFLNMKEMLISIFRGVLWDWKRELMKLTVVP